MDIKKYVITILLSIILIAGCTKGDTTGGRDIPADDVTFEQLMEKYGPKDKTEAEIKALIKSIKWTIPEEQESLASKKAKKGGTLTIGAMDYPATLRIVGEGTTAFNFYYLESLCYQSLIGLHGSTLEFVPELADKWYIADDEVTYYFHINKKAAWSDGRPVTAFDYVATYDLLMSDGLKEPFDKDFWSNYERPAALSKQIVMIKAKEKVWRSFMSAGASLTVMPEHIIGRITPEEYMEKYQDALTVTSGPYMLEKAVRNQYVILKRNPDWWANYDPESRYVYNFDRIKLVFLTERTLIIEKLKKGELDMYTVGVAQKWHKEYVPEKMESIKLNHLVKQRIYNQSPAGLAGIAFNIRKPPFNDIRIRKAVSHLFNREKMMEKLFFNEYTFHYSYFSNTLYENPGNPRMKYDPEEAVRLLEEAGWSQDSLNDEGYLVKDGKVFELDYNVTNPSDTRIETQFKEELEAVGIKLNLKNVTPAAHYKQIDERNFDLTLVGYRTPLFPNPENNLHSRFADLNNTTNVWGFKNDRVDYLCEEYNREFDLQKRIEMVQEIDGIVTREYMTALYWYADNTRMLYWNKFGSPDFKIGRFVQSATPSIIGYWWYDEEKDKALQEALKNKTKLPDYPAEVDHWRK